MQRTGDAGVGAERERGLSTRAAAAADRASLLSFFGLLLDVHTLLSLLILHAERDETFVLFSFGVEKNESPAFWTREERSMEMSKQEQRARDSDQTFIASATPPRGRLWRRLCPFRLVEAFEHALQVAMDQRDARSLGSRWVFTAAGLMLFSFCSRRRLPTAAAFFFQSKTQLS